MKSHRSRLVPLAFLALAPFALAADAGFTSIFNGHDLTGWDGNKALWSVRDGCIVGQTTVEKPTKGNTFLVWQAGKPANFELRTSFRLTAQNEKSFGNSGIQYRSRIVDGAAIVAGDFRIDPAGHMRFAVFVRPGTGARRVGRIVHGVHLPADVTGGWAFGVLVGLGTIELFGRLRRRFDPMMKGES
jgi:hypothetical protein